MDNSAEGPTPRGLLIADAALRILGTGGARALTHRAVDQQAGLPEGATSNLFRTRAALLMAASERLVHHTLTQAADAASRFDPSSSEDALSAARILASIVSTWAGDDADLSAARLEVYLEARRTPELAAQLVEARASFLHLATAVLPAGSKASAVPLIALLEGLLVNQLFHPQTALDPVQLEQALAVWLSAAVPDM